MTNWKWISGMPDQDVIVINTGPILALIAAAGDLSLLKALYARVILPLEVHKEVLEGGSVGFGLPEFRRADWLDIQAGACALSPVLMHSLDIGEASVIQTALNLGVSTVCIDEAMGRRVARLHGLAVTGSLGVLLKAMRNGYSIDLASCVRKMRRQGVWISERSEQKALGMAAAHPHS
jgi:predicted nucleic acid-binding protein